MTYHSNNESRKLKSEIQLLKEAAKRDRILVNTETTLRLQQVKKYSKVNIIAFGNRTVKGKTKYFIRYKLHPDTDWIRIDILEHPNNLKPEFYQKLTKVLLDKLEENTIPGAPSDTFEVQLDRD